MAETKNAAPPAPAPEGGGNGKSKKKKKKINAKKLLIFILVILLIWVFNNFTVKQTRVNVFSDKIRTEFKIAVISDMHISFFGPSIDSVIKKIDKGEPDLVCILGDMYSNGDENEHMSEAVELAEGIIDCGYPVYFVPGEHDNENEYIDMLRDAGVKVMDYKEEYITIGANEIQILGIDNVYFSPTFDLNNAFSLSGNRFSLLLAHIPNYEAYSEFGADLTVCGDSHGGIIQLPFGKGPAYDSDTGTWFPELFNSRSDIYDKGLFPYTGGNMFITSGLGAYPVPARLNNRPEVAFITVSPQQ